MQIELWVPLLLFFFSLTFLKDVNDNMAASVGLFSSRSCWGLSREPQWRLTAHLKVPQRDGAFMEKHLGLGVDLGLQGKHAW